MESRRSIRHFATHPIRQGRCVSQSIKYVIFSIHSSWWYFEVMPLSLRLKYLCYIIYYSLLNHFALNWMALYRYTSPLRLGIVKILSNYLWLANYQIYSWASSVWQLFFTQYQYVVWIRISYLQRDIKENFKTQ